MTVQTRERPAGVATTRARWSGRLRSSPWPWLGPLTALLLAIFAYPIVEIVRLSFTNASLVGEGAGSYTFAAYVQLLSGIGFFQTLRVTFIFVVASIVFQMLLGFLIALVIDEAGRRGLKGTVVTRTAVLGAWAIPGVIIGIIWSILYQETNSGILNYGIHALGFSGNVPFLSDPETALVSVIVANVWRGTALSMILAYAGLQTIPQDLIEAARVDGAGAFWVLRRVVVPLMIPLLTVNLIIVTVETFNTFDMVLALTGGGPGTATEVLALRVYHEIFDQLHLGQGAALAVVLMVINGVMTLGYLAYVERTGRVA